MLSSRRPVDRWLLAALVAAPLACGQPPEPVSPSKPGTKQDDDGKVTKVAEPAQAAGALPAAAEPADLIATLRWKSPAALVTTTAACAKQSAQVFDAGLKMGIDELLKETLRGAADVRQLGALVALDAPVDAVVALDPERKRQPTPVAAVSVGLTSLDGAKRAIEAMGPLTELAPGVWKIGGKDRRNPSCAVAQSTGKTARLVCGERDRDVANLAPYLARTMAAAPPTASDLAGEARWAAMDARFGSELRQQVSALPLLAKGEATGEKKLDDALIEAATALQEEAVALMDDLDKLTLDVRLTPGGCETTGQLGLTLRSKKSWLAGVLGDRPQRSGPPPAIYWRAPKDAQVALWGRGADPARYTRIVRVLKGLIEGGLAKAKIGGPADRKALADLLDWPIDKDASSVSAMGTTEPPPAKPGAKPTTQQQFDKIMGSMLGWTLIGSEQSPDVWSKWLKDLVAVYNRASLMGPIKKELGDDAKSLPTVKTAAAPKELGKGALAVEMAFKVPDPSQPRTFGRNAPPPKTVSMTMHILLMADDKTTWVAIGTNKAELVKRLTAAKSGAPVDGTLASRAGLEKLKSERAMSGGFFTLQPLISAAKSGIEMALTFEPKEQTSEIREIQQIIDSLPNKGATPILLSSHVAVTSGLKSDVALTVPKGVIEDIAKAATAGAALANRKKSP